MFCAAPYALGTVDCCALSRTAGTHTDGGTDFLLQKPGRSGTQVTAYVDLIPLIVRLGFPGGSVAKNLPANAGDASSIPGLGRSPGEENGNPLQYFCPGNPMDRGACWAIVHGVTKESDMT